MMKYFALQRTVAYSKYSNTGKYQCQLYPNASGGFAKIKNGKVLSKGLRIWESETLPGDTRGIRRKMLGVLLSKQDILDSVLHSSPLESSTTMIFQMTCSLDNACPAVWARKHSFLSTSPGSYISLGTDAQLRNAAV